MTLSEKILAARGGQGPGAGRETSWRSSRTWALPTTSPRRSQSRSSRRPAARACRFPERVWLVADHFTPNKDILSAQQVKQMRDFSRQHPGIHFFEQGEVGVEHALLPEMGAIVPGMLVIGADSHTCTYGALGAFSTGMGSTDLAGFYLTGKAWLRVPPADQGRLHGRAAALGDRQGPDPCPHREDLGFGATYKALEFCGPAIDALSGRRTAHHGEHGHRGRGEKRHLRR